MREDGLHKAPPFFFSVARVRPPGQPPPAPAAPCAHRARASAEALNYPQWRHRPRGAAGAAIRRRRGGSTRGARAAESPEWGGRAVSDSECTVAPCGAPASPHGGRLAPPPSGQGRQRLAMGAHVPSAWQAVRVRGLGAQWMALRAGDLLCWPRAASQKRKRAPRASCPARRAALSMPRCAGTCAFGAVIAGALGMKALKSVAR